MRVAIMLLTLLACGSPPAAPPDAPAEPAAAATEPAADPAPAVPAATATDDPSPDDATPEPATPEPATPVAPTGAAGTDCLSNADCATGHVCQGEGCDDAHPGTCVKELRGCTRDRRPFCTCAGETLRTSGSCPNVRYAYAEPCH